MKYLLWFFVGCVCIGTPFFIGYDQHDMWNSAFGGMIGGTLFLILLYFFVVRKKFSSKWKMIIASLFTFHILAFAAFIVVSYRTPTFQRDHLLTMRPYLVNMAIVDGEIYRRALSTLHLYYDQPAEKKKSFVEVFNVLYGKKIHNGIFETEEHQTPRGTFVTYQGDSVVQLIVSNDTISKGIRPDFANINGQKGQIQYTGTMSKHGVTYERNN
ncbi:MAG: hypothetical protein Q8L88_00425 [Bacteroidota bacterium]|nr:hypothetical protein [Bacteroidota bacterium]